MSDFSTPMTETAEYKLGYMNGLRDAYRKAKSELAFVCDLPNHNGDRITGMRNVVFVLERMILGDDK